MIHDAFRPARALLSRSALRHNLDLVRAGLDRQTPLHRAGSKMMAVVKADAYGHGLSQIMTELLRHKVTYFCVASLEEGVRARQLSDRADILVLGGSFRWDRLALQTLKENRLEVAVNDLASLSILSKHYDLSCHLKLDTGMNRLGIKQTDWAQAIEILKSGSGNLKGLMTHYASASGSSFRRQIKYFEEAVSLFRENNLQPDYIHSENSAALFSAEPLKKGLLSETGNLVRPGISLYGYLPNPAGKSSKSLRPILSLTAEIGLRKQVKKREGISYDHLYRPSQDQEVVVVPLGYADGLSKSYAAEIRPEVLGVNGKVKARLRVCGAICMDMVILRRTEGEVSVGDELVFWGPFNQRLIKAKVADPYELNLRIAPRIPRLWSD